MSYLSLNEKYQHIRYLIELARIDNNFSLPELTYIIWVGQKLEISQAELQNLMQESKKEELCYLSEEEKFTQFQRYVNLISTDGNMDLEEVNHLETIGLKMGYQETKLAALKTVLLDNPTEMLAIEQLKELLN